MSQQTGTATESLTAHSSSPELVETPHGEAELLEGGDMDELSKQLERERCVCMCVPASVPSPPLQVLPHWLCLANMSSLVRNEHLIMS